MSKEITEATVISDLDDMIEKAGKRKEKLETELRQININLIIWRRQLNQAINGGTNLNSWLTPDDFKEIGKKTTQHMKEQGHDMEVEITPYRSHVDNEE